MTIDEGGRPIGGLSDYVSGVFTGRAQQAEEAKRLEGLATQKQLDQFIEVTAPLRAHLLQLTLPLEELLTRFRVRGLLEEAQSIHASHQASRLEKDSKTRSPRSFLSYSDVHPGFINDYEVVELRPQVYRTVVLDPQPTRLFDLENETVDFDAIANPINLYDKIPRLWGYGLALSSKKEVTLPVVERHRVWVEESVTKGSNHGVGSCYTYKTEPAYWGWEHVSKSALVTVIKSFSVEAIRAESGNSDYYLMYSHQLHRIDLRDRSTWFEGNPGGIREEMKNGSVYPHGIYPRPLDKQVYLTPLTRVNCDDPAEVLQKLLGDDLIKDMDGEYEDIYSKFKTKGQRRSYSGVEEEYR